MSVVPMPGAANWDGTEFAVDPAGLQGVAGAAGRVYDDVNTAITQWSAATGLSAQALGDSNIAAAYSTFIQAWSPETNLTGLALGDLVQALSTAKQLYEETEQTSAERFERQIGP